MAKQKEHKIPENWREFIGELADNEYFQAAWNYAANRGNTDEDGNALPKPCYAFADAHWQDFEPGMPYGPPKEETEESIREEITRLEKRLERRGPS